MVRRRFRFLGEKRTLDRSVKPLLPGQFIELPDGVTHYELSGPPDAQPIILVHGISVPLFIWDHTLNPLVSAGFRVLRYDIYGRGYSDRPDTIYDLDLYERQLSSLISTLGIDRPVDLIGLSMGGAIAIGFTDRYPMMVRRLGLIGPAGLPMNEHWVLRLTKVPILGEWIMNLFGDMVILSGLKRDFYSLEGFSFSGHVDNYRPQMEYIGFKQALLSTVRSGLITGMKEAYARVGKQDRSVILIWGKEDRVVPYELSEQIRELMPDIEFYPIEKAGHAAHYERPDAVNPILVEFLRR